MSEKNIYFILVFVTVVTGLIAVSEAKSVSDKQSITQDELVQTVDEENPEVAIEKLKESALEDPYVSRSCHYMLHNVGRATYDKYKDLNKSWSFIDDYCSGGYIHGNIHEYFDQRETIPEDFNLCSGFESESSYQWNCNHGTGNAFIMFTDDDLDRSINLCEENFNTSFQKKTCVNGVYVQHFRNIPTGENSSEYDYPGDAFKTCENAKNQYKEECYTYVDDHFQKNNASNMFEMSARCLAVENGSMKNECLESLYTQYGYTLIFEASKYTSGVNIISSLG